MLLALVQNNVVCGIYQPVDDADNVKISSQFQNAIDITNVYPQPQIGWLFNGNQLLDPLGNQPVDWRITKLAFRERFTTAELLGILAASQVAGTEGLILQMMLQNQSLATFIDLSRSDTQAGVAQLVTFGLLTSGRAYTILNTPPVSTEKYQP